MTDHAVYEEQICAMLDGELSADEEASLRAHLDECEACRAFLAAMEAVYGLSAKDLPEAPAELAESVMERVRAQAKPQQKNGKLVRFPYKPLAAAAAAALVLWAGSGLLGALRPKGTMSATAPAAGAMEVYSTTADSMEAAEEAPTQESEPALYAANSAADNGALELDADTPMAEFELDVDEAPALTIRGTEIRLNEEAVTLEELGAALEELGAAETGVALDVEGADVETAKAVNELLAEREIPVL